MKSLIVILAGVLLAGVCYGQTVSVVAETGAFTNVPTVARVEALEDGATLPLLASGKIIVGNSGGTGEAQTVTGDMTLSNAGVAAIAAGVIVNADVATNAAIAGSKLAQAVQDSLGLADSAVQATDAEYTNAVALADSAAQPSDVAGAPAVAGSVATTTNTVTITAKDAGGTTLAQRRLMRVWMAETAYGAPSTNNIESLTLSGGTALQTVTAAADYVYLTADTGIASAEVVGTAAGTNYVMVADGGYVTSAAVVFE
jgi:hypothetical protein